jgi:hypothetical protein
MRRSRSLFGLLLAGVLALPGVPAEAALEASADPLASSATSQTELLARKGKGGGGRKGGSRKKSGGSRKSSSKRSKGKSGFKNSSSGLSRGSKKPKSGYKKNARKSGNPSLERKSAKGKGGKNDRNRTASNRKNDRNRNDDRNRKNDRNRDRKRDDRRDRAEDRRDWRDDRREDRWDRWDDRRDDRWDRIDRRWDRWDDRWDRYPGWARPGWGSARPWNYGWYGGWSRPSWGWWGASAAAWGISSLATAAVINSAVDNAVSNHTTYITVPNSDYGLLYGTVEPVGSESVSFEAISGDTTITMEADCSDGTLNGSRPNTAAEAELLNAACQVAYGSV